MGLNLSTNLPMFVYTFQAMWRHRPLEVYLVFVGIRAAHTSVSPFTLLVLPSSTSVFVINEPMKENLLALTSFFSYQQFPIINPYFEIISFYLIWIECFWLLISDVCLTVLSATLVYLTERCQVIGPNCLFMAVWIGTIITLLHLIKTRCLKNSPKCVQFVPANNKEKSWVDVLKPTEITPNISVSTNDVFELVKYLRNVCSNYLLYTVAVILRHFRQMSYAESQGFTVTYIINHNKFCNDESWTLIMNEQLPTSNR